MLRVLLVAFACAASTFAGGGPETTLLVVNGSSPVSRHVANEYAQLRDLPASHVVFLRDVPHDGVISLDEFREKIWDPIAAHKKRAGLEGQIDLITYSADFPYAVDFKKAMGGGRPIQSIGGQASLTGVTYLIRQVEAGEPFWEILRGNRATQTNRYSRFSFGAEGGRKLTAEERALAMNADRAARTGQLRRASEFYAKFLERAPQYGRIWVAYAICLVRLRQNSKALDALEKAAAHGFNLVNYVEAQEVLAPLRKDPRYAGVLERMRGALAGLRPTRGFRATRAWSAAGDPVDEPDSIHRYYLSTQLAYTGFLGNTVPEVLRYLRSAVSADSTFPDGTVYICENADKRSTARKAFFGPLMSALKARGRKVELLPDTKVPQGKDDVIGAVVGIAGFNWGQSKSVILPGAICEHLTSYGAHFGLASQTKISEFLRFGAAGSSGAIMEPLALHVKFPNPLIHAFYADGCTLAEAFYQSVHGPYQLMVAGDGLTQPFAKAPEFTVDAPPAPWKGKVTLTPKGNGATYELWVDGVRVANGASLTWDTTKVRDGWHDVRVAAVATNLLETRGRKTLPVTVDNRGAKLEVSAKSKSVAYGEPIRLSVEGASAFEVWCGAEKVSTRAEVDSARVGPGPVRLVVRTKDAQSAPVTVDVTAPKLAAPLKEPVEAALGLACLLDGAEPVAITSMASRPAGVRMRDQLKGKRDIKSMSMSGALEAKADGFFQLNVKADGKLTVRVAGRELCKAKTVAGQIHLPAPLAKGWHALEIEYEPRGLPDLELYLAGDQVAAPPSLGRPLASTPTTDWAKGEWAKGKKGGFVVTRKKRAASAKVRALAVLPEKGAVLPKEWTVEWKKGRSWKAVEGLVVVVVPPSRKAPRPKKGEKPKPLAPLAVEFRFKPVKTKQIRLVPKSAASVRAIVVPN
ncbi:MAG: hypothetical protein ACYTGZ_07935 [Planctomycetota bacterium]|jgi:tetratricopeptide (TPR) repeat protein